jgi:HAMP domain-containing protein
MPNVKLQTLILITVAPLLGMISLVTALSHYLAIRQSIMRGFDQTLFAVSTVTAAMIDPEVHTSIYRPEDIRILTYHPEDGRWYGMNQSGLVYIINPNTGGAVPLLQTNAYNLTDLSAAPGRQRLYGVNGTGRQLVQIDLATNRVRSQPLSAPVSGIAYDPTTNTLYGSHHTLMTLNSRTGDITPLAPLPTLIRSLTVHSTGLYGLALQDQPLLMIQRETGATAPPPFLDHLMATSQQSLVGITSSRDRLWVAGSQQLFHVDLASGVVEAAPATGYRSEETPEYQGYIQPMARISDRLNLTYVYTQIVSGDRSITYVLDATEGEEHTPIGFVEHLTAEEFSGIERVNTTGQVYLSGIKPWEEWGLLKVAYAPILNRTGQVVAMAGADVNISIITQKTRVALFRVMGVGVGSLLVGVGASIYIARRLTQPIESVKTMALKIAAGQYGQQIDIQTPQEIAALVQSFNHMSRALQQNLTALQTTNNTLEGVRQQQELIELLGQTRRISLDPGYLPVIQLYTPDPGSDGAGWVAEGSRILLWLTPAHSPLTLPHPEPLSTHLPHPGTELAAYAQQQRDRLLTVRRYKELERILSRLLQHYVDWASIRQTLTLLFPQDVSSFVFYDATTRTVHSIARQSSPFMILSHDQSRQVGNFLDTPELQLAPHQVLVLMSSVPRGTQEETLSLERQELTALLSTLEDSLDQTLQRYPRKAAPIFIATLA